MSEPRHMLHRGSVPAVAILVDATAIGEAEARRRVIAAWEPGSIVRAIDGTWIVEWASPRVMRVDRAPGVVLTAMNDSLVALPLGEAAWRAMEIPARSLVRAKSGRVVIDSLSSATVVDIASWIELPANVIATESLGEPPAPPPVVQVSGESDARAVFAKKVAPASDAIRRAIDDVRAATEAKTGGAASTGGSSGVGWFAAMAAAILAPLAAMFGGSERGGPYRSGSASQLPASETHEVEDRPRESLRTRIGRWLARVVSSMGLARLLGQRQAEYVRRMLDMFETGDWENALRHAIPLGKDGTANSSPALGVPSPRTKLEISKGPLGASSSIGGGGGLYDYLRKIYREAFEKLDAAGEYERAAFVLAELLQASEEAVAYLERKGELRLAAEIAEARGLAPDLVVRQWFVAGDRERALRIARYTGCFAAAVARLERNGRNATADELRHAWASQLARAGNYVMAADVAMYVDAARDDVREWLLAAKTVGGLSRVRALAMELGLGLEPSPSDRLAFEDILDDRDADAASARAIFAQLLVGREANPWSRVVARGLARGLLRDGATRGDASIVSLAHRAANFADALVGADFPKVPTFTRKPFSQRADVVRIEIGPHDRGAIAVHDVAAAPSGGVLVALGEAGVRWLTREGRIAATFDVPARWLVVSDHGSRVLAIARRGDAFRVSRIDLANRRAEAWSEMLLTRWADTFDGDQWIVARGRELLVLDACASELRALRRIDDLDGGVASITRTAQLLDLVLADGEEVNRWRYDLPAWTLRIRRRAASFVASKDALFTVLDDGTEARVGLAADSPWNTLALCDNTGTRSQVVLSHNEVGWWPLALRGEGSWIATAFTEADRVRAVLADRRANVRIDLALAGRTRAAVRVQNESFWIGDDAGIVMRIGLDTGTVQQRWVLR